MGIPTVVGDVLDKRSSLERQVYKLGELAEALLDHTRATDSELIRVANVLDEIERELLELIELKTGNGYFKEIVNAAPERQHTVDVLLEDHEKLLADLSRMRDELPEADHCLTVRRHLHGWIQRFREFDSREITLLQNIWNVDVGVGD